MNLMSLRNKKNIEFIAFGSNQIEIFNVDGGSYFVVYDPNPEATNKISFCFGDCRISLSEGGYLVSNGNCRYIFTIKMEKNVIKMLIEKKLWGWLPYSRFSGKLSIQGLEILRKNFNAYAIKTA